MEERLQKVLAQAGVASRRACEELILAGRVTVNGRVIKELGTKVDPEKCKIEVDRRPVGGKEDHVYILLNKPAGYVTTAYDPQGRKTVLDLVTGINARIYPVGRLDLDTSGLLILTNDGTLTNDLIHPSREVKKKYRALVRGIPSEADLEKMRRGLILEDGLTAPAQVRLLQSAGANALIDVTIHEGRNRQVRRMFGAIGHPVLRLERVAFGFLTLKNLPLGHWRKLTLGEIQKLRRLAGKNR